MFYKPSDKVMRYNMLTHPLNLQMMHHPTMVQHIVKRIQARAEISLLLFPLTNHSVNLIRYYNYFTDAGEREKHCECRIHNLSNSVALQ